MADRSRSREADKGVCAHYNPRSMKPIRILIVDDHPIMRVGVAALVATSKEMVVAGQVGTGEEAIEQHALLKPDVTLDGPAPAGDKRCGNHSPHPRQVP